MRVLLDTHIFIWYAKEQDKLPLTKAKAREKLSCDGLDDKFDTQLAYRSVPLKQYLKSIMV